MCDCPGPPDPVIDYAGGAEVCRACGVVLGGGVVFAEGREWFEDGQARAGPAEDPFAPRGPATRLDNPRGVSRRVLAAAAADGGERALREAFRALDLCGRHMRLPPEHAVLSRARELLRDLHAVKPVRGDAREPTAAAALYYGFKMESAPRELKDVAARCQVRAGNAWRRPTD